MKLVVLGSGTCLNPRPGTVGRMPPLFALDVGAPGAPPAGLLFDCSEGARWRLPAVGIDPSDVAHVAVSHPHPDHAALPQFIQGRACEAIFRARPRAALALSVYLPARAAATVRDLWAWHQPEDEGAATSRFPLDVVAAPDGFAREVLPGVVLRAFAVHHGHGRCPALAWRVEARGRVFAYSGDTGLCAGVERAARGADLFVCEAAARIGQDMARTYGHLNPRQAGEVARAAGAARLYLTHYGGEDPPAAMVADALAAGYAGDARVAADGEIVNLA